ncbi:LysR substrate-binding domain-containing protein [Pediococcus siamensis]|uniref:LysR substrate-binding domain-containing protein n=1 Tax=Pediococcus siamensis TaxID=381829 RepID=UPI0039A0E1F8
MEMEDFRAFVTVYQLRSISRAAVQLSMTQSNLSKRLGHIQDEVGIELIDTHNKHHLAITEAGNSFYNYSVTLLSQYKQLKQTMTDFRELRAGVIRIGAVPILSQYDLTQIINHFAQEYPQVKVHVIEDEGDHILSLLTSDQINIAVLRDTQTYELSDQAYRKIPLLADELKVVLPAQHPLANRPFLRVADLKDTEIATLPKGSGVYEPMITAFNQNQIRPRIFFETSHIETIMGMIKKSNKAAFLFQESAQPFLTPDFVIKSLSPQIFSTLEMVYHYPVSDPVIKGFIKKFQN